LIGNLPAKAGRHRLSTDFAEPARLLALLFRPGA
jgi:hypothetical protein